MILESSPGLREKPFTIEARKRIAIGGVRHEIDIFVTVEVAKGYTATFIFECKNWEAAVGKNEIIVFTEKIDALTTTRGYFVAKSFTKDAEAQALKDARITRYSPQQSIIRRRICRLLASILLVVVLQAQSAAEKDQLGRNTPQESVFHFLEACHAHDYQKALLYFDLRGMSREDRSKNGPQLARQLEDLLDDTPFGITTLSRDPEGDQSDGLPPNRERLDTFHVNKQNLDLQLERVELKPGFRVWLVSADSVPMIPTAHQLVAETPFEKKLPQQLVTFEVFNTPVWRWIALAIMAVAIWVTAVFLSWGLVRVVRRLVDAPGLRGPIRICLAVIGFRMAMELASPSTLPRLYMERALGMIFFWRSPGEPPLWWIWLQRAGILLSTHGCRRLVIRCSRWDGRF